MKELLAGVTALSLLLAISASAQETAIPKTAEAPPPGWVLTCQASPAQAPLECRLSQELFSAEARARVLAVSVAKAKSGDGFDMTLAMPHGVYLPAGVSLKIDDAEPIEAQVESSNATGIFLTLPLDEKLAPAIKRGKTLLVGITNMSGKTLQIPVNLAGFTAAFTRMQALK